MITKIYKRVKHKSDGAPAKRAEVEARAGRETQTLQIGCGGWIRTIILSSKG